MGDRSRTGKGKCKFNVIWCSDPKYASWVEPAANDVHSAFCKLCRITFSVQNMGISALSSHKRSKKHFEAVRAKQISGQILKNAKNNEENAKENSSSMVCLKNCAKCCNITNAVVDTSTNAIRLSKKTNLCKYLVKDEVNKAELIWCIQGVLRHLSLRDIEENISISKVAFPDNQTAGKMSLVKTKVAYTIVYSIAKYFENEMNNLMATTTEIVLGFDESPNKISQKKQMDIILRFWDETKNEVATRYYTSAFLRKSSALDLLDAVKSSISTDILVKVIQISMDGPNVNIKFAIDFQADLNEVLKNKTLLDLGSCGLHTVHGAFKTGFPKTEWKLIDFLRASYKLFKDVPSRRPDYTAASGSTKFPKKFCAIRWLENVPVVQAARSISPKLKKIRRFREEK